MGGKQIYVGGKIRGITTKGVKNTGICNGLEQKDMQGRNDKNK